MRREALTLLASSESDSDSLLRSHFECVVEREH